MHQPSDWYYCAGIISVWEIYRGFKLDQKRQLWMAATTISSKYYGIFCDSPYWKFSFVVVYIATLSFHIYFPSTINSQKPILPYQIMESHASLMSQICAISIRECSLGRPCLEAKGDVEHFPPAVGCHPTALTPFHFLWPQDILQGRQDTQKCYSTFFKMFDFFVLRL